MWLKPQGYAFITSPKETAAVLDRHRQQEQIAAGLAEFDTATCRHCNSVFHVGARRRPEDIGGLCKVCMGVICPNCLDGPCVPFERKLEEEEHRSMVMRSYGLE